MGVIYYTPVVDAVGTLTDLALAYLNPAAQRMTQLPARPGTTYRQQFPTTDENGAWDFHRRTWLSGEPQHFQFYYAADGFDSYFRVASQRLGEGLLAVFTDTQDEVRSQALLASQARERAALARAEATQREAEAAHADLANVFTQAPAMICIFEGPAHTFQFVNPPYQALVGERPLLGKPIAEAMPELAGQPIFGLLDHVYQTGETFTASEMPVQLDHYNEGRSELEKRYYNFIYKARHNRQGGVDGILVFAYEVTPQVLARAQVQNLNEELAAINEELRATNEEYQLANMALGESQQQLQQLTQELEARVQGRTRTLHNLFAQAPMALVVLRGPQFRIEQANAQAEVIWGVPVAQVLGRPHFEAVPGSAGQGFEELLTGVLESGEAVVLREVLIKLARAHTGLPGEGYYNVIFKPLFDEGQPQPSGIVVMWTETTDQVLARQQVQDLNEELAAINEELTVTNEELHESNTQLTRTNVELDTFVYTASHDLKAPITNIEAIALALRDTLPADVQQDEMIAHLLNLLEQTTARFQLTIGQLTDLSKLQLAHAGPAEVVPLAPVIEAVRLDLAPALAAAAAQLTVAVAPDLAISFSPANLRSAIYNLLSNAVKYRAPDRLAQVQVRAFSAGPQVVLQVQDNGLGLNAHQQSRLFGLFQRLHTHVEGTGVGLYTLKRIVDNAGGTIAVRSQLGLGTTFTITLPD